MKKLDVLIAQIFDLNFHFEDTAGLVVLSTEVIFMYCRILHFLPHCFVTLEVLISCL